MDTKESNIDSIWKEMEENDRKVSEAYKKRIKGRTSLNTLTAIKRSKRRVDKKKKKSYRFNTTTLKNQTKNMNEETVTITTTKSFQQEDKDTLIRKLAHHVNQLSSEEERSKRQRAAKHIRDVLVVQTSKVRADVWSELLMKSVLKLVSDPIESIRDIALEMIHSNATLPEVDFGASLPYLFPVLMDRIPNNYAYDESTKVFVADIKSHESHLRGRVSENQIENTRRGLRARESSEELRLSLCKLMSEILVSAESRGASSLLLPYFQDIVLFVQAMLRDSFAEVKREACSILRKINKTYPSCAKFYAVAFCRELAEVLQHRHARIRIAALDAVHATVSCEDKAKQKGAGTEAINDLLGHRDSNVIPVAAFYGKDKSRKNAIAMLVVDKSQSVRRKTLDVIGDWLINLPDRFDHRGRLLPYALSFLCDPINSVRNRAMEILNALGQEYEKEHKEEILEKRQYGVDGSRDSNHDLPLPEPFRQRPRIGTRMYVRDVVSRFLKPLLGELKSWQSETRQHAAKMLRVVLIFMEEHITMELKNVMTALLRNVCTDSIEKEMRECCELLGRFVPPEAYLGVLLPHVRGDRTANTNADAKSIAKATLVLSSMCAGTLSRVLLPHTNDILSALEDVSRELGNTMSSQFRLKCFHVLNTLTTNLSGKTQAVIDAIFTKRGRLPDLNRTRKRIYTLSLVLRARGGDRMLLIEDAKSRGNMRLVRGVKEELEIIKEMKRKLKFCEDWIEEMIPCKVTNWTRDSEEFVVLREMLKHELCCEEKISKYFQRLCKYASNILQIDELDKMKSSDLCCVLDTIEMFLMRLRKSRLSNSSSSSSSNLVVKLTHVIDDCDDEKCCLRSLRCLEKLFTRAKSISPNEISRSLRNVVKRSRAMILEESSTMCRLVANCFLTMIRLKRFASELDVESCTFLGSLLDDRDEKVREISLHGLEELLLNSCSHHKDVVLSEMLLSERRRFSTLEILERVLTKSHDTSRVLLKILPKIEGSLSQDECDRLRLSCCCDNADESHKELGDRYFREHKFQDAVKEYTKCLEMDACNNKARLNRAAALLQVVDTSRKDVERALTDCVVVIASKNCTAKQRVKALFRKGRALSLIGDREGALVAYKRASLLEPENEKIRSVLNELTGET